MPIATVLLRDPNTGKNVIIDENNLFPVAVMAGGGGGGGGGGSLTPGTPSAVRLSDGTNWITTLPVTTGLIQGLTDAQLRASAVPVSTGLVQGLTDAQLRASAVPVSSNGLTDAQLRATPVPVTGGLTDAQLRASPISVLTNTQRDIRQFIITPTLDTAAYATGDILFGLTVISGVASANGRPCVIRSMTVIDSASQSQALEVHIFNTNSITIGALNSVWNVSALDMSKRAGVVAAYIGSYITYSGYTIAENLVDMEIDCAPDTGSSDIYIAGRINGAATYVANSLRIVLTVERL
jgi:hypothetical protein